MRGRHPHNFAREGGRAVAAALAKQQEREMDRLNEMQEDRKTVEALAAQYWKRFNDEDRAVVRMGMIPAWAPVEITKNLGEDLPDDFVRLFAVAIMGQAERDGGMIA